LYIQYVKVQSIAKSVRTPTRWSTNTVQSRFTAGLRSRIFGCKSNRRKTSTI